MDDTRLFCDAPHVRSHFGSLGRFDQAFFMKHAGGMADNCRSPEKTSCPRGSSGLDASQVKLLITNNAFIVQRATAQSKQVFFRDCGVAEAPPSFQAGWSDCMYFFFSLSAHLARSSGFFV
jgi:hypothetical protein